MLLVTGITNFLLIEAMPTALKAVLESIAS
jgi:hypothetical protein